MQIKKVISGVFLIILSFGLAAAAFYQWEVKPELASRQAAVKEKPTLPEEPKTESVEQKTLVIPLNNQEEVKSVKPKEVPVDPIDTALEDVPVALNGKNSKVQGYLWINRKSSKYVVTLGKKNGLAIGSTLLVYQDDKKLGKVEVDTVYDTIAYVHPIDISAELSEGDYYRVIPQ